MPRSLATVSTALDDLDDILAQAWRLLSEGVTDRNAPLHTPSVATLRGDGLPSVRTVVLRGVDPAARRLRFHSDRRSAKISEIRANARVALHAYDPGRKLQLRLEGSAQVHEEDALAEAAWAASRPFSRACYRVMPGPGSAIGDPSGAVTHPLVGDEDPGRENFCAVAVTVDALEWLYLSAQGHRRARFEWREEGLSAGWLVP